MSRHEQEKAHWAKVQKELMRLLNDLIERDHLIQAEIAQKCNWYNSHKKPDQARVSSYTTGKKFSMAAYTWMIQRVWGMTLTQFFAAATNDTEMSLEQTEITRIMDDLSVEQNRVIVEAAKAMQKTNLQNERLKKQVRHLKSS